MNIYEYILLSNFVYIYILYIYTIYIYTINVYMNFVLFVYCNIVATHTYDGHTDLTFTRSFPACFNSRNDLRNCEHDPSY